PSNIVAQGIRHDRTRITKSPKSKRGDNTNDNYSQQREMRNFEKNFEISITFSDHDLQVISL
ncbi:MAG: hypothetical protein ABF459_04830, partial [Gluconobacter cerinus]|uniref:hypothetical protein n=1 Tax=Gluconobacter cerinus TaxID=38307 RepID=UPI0039ED56F6